MDTWYQLAKNNVFQLKKLKTVFLIQQLNVFHVTPIPFMTLRLIKMICCGKMLKISLVLIFMKPSCIITNSLFITKSSVLKLLFLIAEISEITKLVLLVMMVFILKIINALKIPKTSSLTVMPTNQPKNASSVLTHFISNLLLNVLLLIKWRDAKFTMELLLSALV